MGIWLQLNTFLFFVFVMSNACHRNNRMLECITCNNTTLNTKRKVMFVTIKSYNELYIFYLFISIFILLIMSNAYHLKKEIEMLERQC